MNNKKIISYKLSEISKQFLYWGKYERTPIYSPATIEGYEAVFRRMIGWLDDKDVRKITLDDLMEIKAMLVKRGCRDGYVYKQLTVMRTLFATCRKKFLIEVLDPDEIEIHPAKPNTVDYLTPDELKKFVDVHMEESSTIFWIRQMTLITVLLDSGMRISEALSLDRWGKHAINFEAKNAQIVGKGGRTRLVFFRDWSLWWIKKYISLRTDDQQALFITHRENPYGIKRFIPEDARRFFRIASKKAGIRTVSPHVLRRTSATSFRHNGGDTKDIQHFLGHTTLMNTQRYLGVDYGKIQEAHAKHLNYGGIEVFGKENIKVEVIWARDAGYRKCQVCGTTERRHAGHGYCDICYIRAMRAGTLKKKIKKQEIKPVPLLVDLPTMSNFQPKAIEVPAMTMDARV